MYSLFNLTVVLICCAIGAAWWTSIRAKELAIAHARNTCAREDLQLLDQTVALKSCVISRSTAGQACLKRQYSFEFTQQGEFRDKGTVTMTGHKLAGVSLPFTRDENGNRVFVH